MTRNVHGYENALTGGARFGVLRQAGRMVARWMVGSPQQEQVGAGLGGGSGTGPSSSGRPVWKAMRSRLAFEAGWQNPWYRIARRPLGNT